MKRKTHLLMGAAAAVPIALTVPPIGAAACLWLGLTGGGLPDYIDLRSEARRSLRHRGTSHSLVMVALIGGFAWFVLDALSRADIRLFPVPASSVWPWTIALASGMASHLLGDACTKAGIQPLLPLFRWRCWILPRALRGRSDGWLNHLATVISFLILGFGIAGYILAR